MSRENKKTKPSAKKRLEKRLKKFDPEEYQKKEEAKKRRQDRLSQDKVRKGD